MYLGVTVPTTGSVLDYPHAIVLNFKYHLYTNYSTFISPGERFPLNSRPICTTVSVYLHLDGLKTSKSCPEPHVLSHLWGTDLTQMQQYYETLVTLREAMHGKGRELRT
jgi:hypothetical protein